MNDKNEQVNTSVSSKAYPPACMQFL